MLNYFGEACPEHDRVFSSIYNPYQEDISNLYLKRISTETLPNMLMVENFPDTQWVKGNDERLENRGYYSIRMHKAK